MSCKVIANGVINLLVKRCAGPFWIRRNQLAQSQWFSEQELRQLQLKLLKRIIRHCYKTVPYYRNLMDDWGISADSIRTLDDIKLFPILSKKNVLEAEDSIISTKYPQWALHTARTGGTTGTPLQILRDLFSIGNEHAFVRRQWDWAGIGLRDRCAYLTGRLIVKPDETRRQLCTYDPLMKELILSTYHLSTSTAKDYALAMKRYKVKAIVGYPSAVGLLARTCLDSGARLDLKAVLTSSETLGDLMKATISEAFGCPVYDYYGSAERVCYIFTCEKGRYHIQQDYGLAELIPLDSEGNTCKLVATGFWNRAMPLVRYDTGDVVIKSEDRCPCGREFPVVNSIEGRQADSVRTPSGREFGAAILTHLLYGTGHIIESQLIQDAADHLTIEFVPGKEFSEADLSAFRKLVVKHLPTELKFDFKEVKAVRRTSDGKVRPVVNQLEGSET